MIIQPDELIGWGGSIPIISITILVFWKRLSKNQRIGFFIGLYFMSVFTGGLADEIFKVGNDPSAVIAGFYAPMAYAVMFSLFQVVVAKRRPFDPEINANQLIDSLPSGMNPFKTIFPELCVICTSLSQKALSTETSADKLENLIYIAAGSYLGLDAGPEVDKLVAALKRSVLRIHVISGLGQSDILGDKGRDKAVFTLSLFKMNPGEYYLLPVAMKDPLGDTDYIALYFFFKAQKK